MNLQGFTAPLQDLTPQHQQLPEGEDILQCQIRQLLQESSALTVTEEEEKENPQHCIPFLRQQPLQSSENHQQLRSPNIARNSMVHRHITVSRDNGRQTEFRPTFSLQRSSEANADQRLATKTPSQTSKTHNHAFGKGNTRSAREVQLKQWAAERAATQPLVMHPRAVHFSTSISSHSVKTSSGRLWPRNQTKTIAVAQGQRKDSALSSQKSKLNVPAVTRHAQNWSIDNRQGEKLFSHSVFVV